MPQVKDVAACMGCPMQRLFPLNNLVPPKLVSGSRLAVGEAPGEEEARAAEPFVGPSGSWLRSCYRNAGVRFEEVSLANTLCCRPPANVYPLAAEARSYISLDEARQAADQCWHAHIEPILAHQWTRIDAIGDRALTALTGRKGITTWRGSILADPMGREIVVPTLHPAFIARNQNLLPALVSDLAKSCQKPPEFYNTAPTLEDIRGFNATEFAFDIETRRSDDSITMVGLCDRSYHAIVVPFTGPYIPELARIFAAASGVVGHNCIQFDLPRLAKAGVTLSSDCQVWDTMLMQHLLQPDMDHDLGFVGSLFTNKGAWKHLHYDDEPTYCARDTDVTWQCYRQLRVLLRQEQLDWIYNLVSVPLARICHGMQSLGFRLNPGRLVELREKYATEIRDLQSTIPEGVRSYTFIRNLRRPAPPGTLSPKTGKPLKFITEPVEEIEHPWRSNEILKKLLYENWNLPPQLHVKTGELTADKTAFDKLLYRLRRGTIRPKEIEAAEAIRVLEAIKRCKKLSTLISNFLKEKHSDAASVHPHFNVHGTASGRLSSSDPNLQNIPGSTRYLYVPHRPGWKIIEADYSQAENRITAHLAGDRARLERLATPGFSEHKFAASLFFGIPIDQVVKDNDRDTPYGKAKPIVHGTNYGEGYLRIAKQNDLDPAETRDNLAKWKQAIRPTIAWQEATAQRAKRDKVLITPFGRKRWFYTSSWYTESLSFIPQSVVADMIFRAMIGLMWQRIDWPFEKAVQVARICEPLPEPAQLLLQVHDSLVFECPAEMVDEVCRLIQRVMEQPWGSLGDFWVPVEIKVGDSWGECKPWRPAV